MKKVVIIDDEPLARNIVKEYLSALPEYSVVAECGDGFEGLKAIRDHQPALVILDIQMPRISGFEMLELLNHPPPVIFATAFDEYAIRAFDNNAVDYLLKPFSEKRFRQALDKVQASDISVMESADRVREDPDRQEAHNQIVVRSGSDISIIPVSDILYIEAFDDYVKIFTEKAYFLKKRTLSYYEQALDASRFFRTHRSYIISLNQLSAIEPLEKNTYIALLRNGKKVPLSRSGYLRLKQKLGV